MADGRRYNGGHPNSGRKSKAEELKLIQKLTPYEDKAISLLFRKIDEEDMSALKMFFEYLYGKPKQQQDIDLSTNDSGIAFKELVSVLRGDGLIMTEND